METETKTATSTAWEFPADVLEFAYRKGLDEYLGPLTAALDRIFPTPRSKRLSLEADHGGPGDTVLMFDILVTEADLPTAADDLAATRAWHRELGRIVPATACYFFPMRLQYAEE